ncbi:hypothetical protein PAPYR_473 [Paratrimastix pyriformis]|uniref:Uncharacterized protein n=1 Tax=Paratrimastix pyriformis TaxID=342808 RepID=A0ABQ8UTQ1_9EUKA|nr:hypothetical protein PAPYR_473 [Paratrimastix pyriformis]
MIAGSFPVLKLRPCPARSATASSANPFRFPAHTHFASNASKTAWFSRLSKFEHEPAKMQCPMRCEGSLAHFKPVVHILIKQATLCLRARCPKCHAILTKEELLEHYPSCIPSAAREYSPKDDDGDSDFGQKEEEEHVDADNAKGLPAVTLSREAAEDARMKAAEAVALPQGFIRFKLDPTAADEYVALDATYGLSEDAKKLLCPDGSTPRFFGKPSQLSDAEIQDLAQILGLR